MNTTTKVLIGAGVATVATVVTVGAGYKYGFRSIGLPFDKLSDISLPKFIKNQTEDSGQFDVRFLTNNQQYGPYKLCRITKDTNGLVPELQETILTFNSFCGASYKNQIDEIPDEKSLREMIFERPSYVLIDNYLHEYQQQLIKCLVWKQDSKTNKYFVDTGETFNNFFSAENHEIWTDVLVDNSEKVANQFLTYDPDIIMLQETSEGAVINGKVIPGTDNLTRVLNKINKLYNYLVKSKDHKAYAVAKYSQFDSEVQKKFPQLARGNAILYNQDSYNYHDDQSFVINFTTTVMKRGKPVVTTRRYPVCVFSDKRNESNRFVACSVHLPGFGWNDSKLVTDKDVENSMSRRKDKDSVDKEQVRAELLEMKKTNISSGDNELGAIIQILDNTFVEYFKGTDITITFNSEELNMGNSKLKELFENISKYPRVVAGDFNRDFQKNGFEHDHPYLIPTVSKEINEGASTEPSLVEKFEWRSIYESGIIRATIGGYESTIDGAIFKGFAETNDQILESKSFTEETQYSDHSPVAFKLQMKN